MFQLIFAANDGPRQERRDGVVWTGVDTASGVNNILYGICTHMFIVHKTRKRNRTHSVILVVNLFVTMITKLQIRSQQHLLLNMFQT